MLSMRSRKLAGCALAAALCFACDDSNGPSGSDSPVVGDWKGRYQIEGLGITINLLMRIAPNHSYQVDATPNLSGLDTVRIYEEKGNWSVAGNLFIATKTSCRAARSATDLALRDTLCPPPDTSVINIVGDSAWTSVLRGQEMTLTRAK